MTQRDDDGSGAGPGSAGGSGSGGGGDPWIWSPEQRPGGGAGGESPGSEASAPGGSSGPPPAPPYGYGSGYGAAGSGAGYGAGYGYPVRQLSTNAVVALVLAIASYPICPIIFAIVALIVARSADREIAASGGLKEGAGMVRAARIVAWINIALFGGMIVLFVALGLAGAAFSWWTFPR